MSHAIEGLVTVTSEDTDEAELDRAVASPRRKRTAGTLSSAPSKSGDRGGELEAVDGVADLAAADRSSIPSVSSSCSPPSSTERRRKRPP